MCEMDEILKFVESDIDIPEDVSCEIPNNLVYKIFSVVKKKNTSPVPKISSYLSSLSGIDIDAVSLPALSTKIYRLYNDVKRKGGKGRKILLQKQFIIPLLATTSYGLTSKVEKNIISELTHALNESSVDLDKKQTLLSKLRKEKKALQRKVRSSKMVKTKKVSSNLIKSDL